MGIKLLLNVYDEILYGKSYFVEPFHAIKNPTHERFECAAKMRMLYKDKLKKSRKEMVILTDSEMLHISVPGWRKGKAKILECHDTSGVDFVYLATDYFDDEVFAMDISETRLLDRLKDLYDGNKFIFYKIATDRKLELGEKFYPTDQNVTDTLNQVYMTGNAKLYYTECLKYFLYERYYVDRDGDRTYSVFECDGDWFPKGMIDFQDPEAFKDMITWEYPQLWRLMVPAEDGYTELDETYRNWYGNVYNNEWE